LLEIDEQVEEQISQGLAPSDTPNNDVYQPIFTLFVDDNTNDKLGDADLSVDNIGTAQVSDGIALLLDDSDRDTESKVDITEDNIQPIYVNDGEISIEENTSIEIRGPPANKTINGETISFFVDSEDELEVDPAILNEYATEVQPDGTLDLPGMHLVEPTVDYFDGQIVYIDFDGETDVIYNGPVVVEGVNIPEFSAESAGLDGQETVIISQILSSLEQEFEGTGVLFTTDKPESGISYSTIFVGGDDSAFAEYGSFLGLAEKVDVWNQDPSDNAFIFSESIHSDTLDADYYPVELAQLIAHEVSQTRRGQRTSRTNAEST